MQKNKSKFSGEELFLFLLFLISAIVITCGGLYMMLNNEATGGYTQGRFGAHSRFIIYSGKMVFIFGLSILIVLMIIVVLSNIKRKKKRKK
ncbi:MAG: hypothetical protein PHD97_04330 [Bacteroidales bacterium]|nr:hypothetical protein [Bacteroidales bacterium]